MIRDLIAVVLLALAPAALAQTAAAAPPDPIASIVRRAPVFFDGFDKGVAAGEWDRGLSPWPDTIANRILPGTGERQIYVDAKYLGVDTLVTPATANTGGTLIFMSRRMDGGTRAKVANRVAAEKANPVAAAAIGKADWMSAVIKSRRSWLYGYFETSIRWDLQPESWPAFWFLPAKWAGEPEADACEMRIEAGVPMCVSGIHTSAPGYQRKVCRTPIPNKGMGYHSYGMLWTATTTTFYIDRKPVCTMPTPANMHAPMYVIINNAIGGWGKAPTAATRDPQVMQVDYFGAWAQP